MKMGVIDRHWIEHLPLKAGAQARCGDAGDLEVKVSRACDDHTLVSCLFS